MSRQRLDKFLFFSRAVKSRTLAQRLIEAGAIRVNSEKTLRTDHQIGAGDVLTINIRSRVLVWRVRDLARTAARPAKRRPCTKICRRLCRADDLNLS